MRKCLALIAISLMAACSADAPSMDVQPAPVTTLETNSPDWSRDAVIYQINTRQYSDAGTFAAVEADLPRIKALGVDILWLMPIHPIGEEKRKGSMGSPYAVKDYQAVNPELGTLDDFKSLVDSAHAQGMKVIIDWVANHTAWDNPMITAHPDWYTRDAQGQMQHPPDTDWEDVADLDFSQEGLRDYMTESLVYWLKEVGIDGYRCDVAGMVPTEFWNDARPELDKIKPVFMLAEWQEPELHEEAFDASYAWRWKEILQDIVKGEANATDLAGYYADYQADWPRDAMRMAYTSNHDQNTWDGLPMEIYDDAYEAAIVLSFIGEGVPLIYNGQECHNQNRLDFFEKDPIDWTCEHPINALFTQLTQFKTDNPALHNGAWGGRTETVENSNPKTVFSFLRRVDDNRVLGLFNMSGEAQTIEIMDSHAEGAYIDFKSSQPVTIKSAVPIMLEPWEWRVHSSSE